MAKIKRRAKTRRSKPRVCVGMDLSITGTGYAIFNTKGELINSGVYGLPANKKRHQMTRYMEVSGTLIEMMELHRFQVDCLVIEDFAYGGSGRLTALGENAGIIKYRLLAEGLLTLPCLYICSVQQLKMFITGKGAGDKNKIMLEAYKRWGFEGRDDNETDAYGLARLGMALAWDEVERKMDERAIEAVRDANPFGKYRR